MIELYIRPGIAPQPLPLVAFDASGQAWTDLANSEEGRTATGWNRKTPQRPDDTETQTVEWDADAGDWVMVDRPPAPTSSPDDVNAEAARRIAAGFAFEGKRYDYDDKAQKRITGAATLAGFAQAAGALAGFLFWHGGDSPFEWIAADNSLTPMDAPTCFRFGQAAAAWESAHVVGPNSARALKDMPGGIPADYADDAYWP